VAGPDTGEMLGLSSLAVHVRLPPAELRSMIYAFPTFYGGMGETGRAHGRGLSTVIDPGHHGFDLLNEAGAAEGA
jgi:hypothetical protein